MSRWEWVSISFCFIAICFIFGFYFIEFQSFYKGLQNLKNKDYRGAEENFLKTLSQDAQNFPARLNLALTKFLQKDFESALQEYDKVGKESFDSLERFYAFFNSGHIYSHKEDKDKALNFYQKALDEKPDSLKTKTNIELMFQKELSQDSENQSSKDKRDSKESSKSKEGKSQSSLGEEENEVSPSDSKNRRERSQEGELDTLSSEQVQFILKEIENKEQELKMRLHKQPKDNQQRKKW